MQVLVDDNNRVKKGDLLVQLDKEPYQVQVAIKQAAVGRGRGEPGGRRGQGPRPRWPRPGANRLEAPARHRGGRRPRSPTPGPAWPPCKSKEATLDRAQADFDAGRGTVRRAARHQQGGLRPAPRRPCGSAEAAVAQALEEVYADAGLPRPARPAGEGQDLTDVPADLNQTFSTVRQALAAAASRPWPSSACPRRPSTLTPNEALDEFSAATRRGTSTRSCERLVPKAPAVQQAEAKLLQARHDLDQAELNLRYCDIVSEIDGVVTGRNVNPGNNVQAGQSLMAVRSLTEIWIDANFKETQLADLRIGQRVRCEVDMYGSRQGVRGPDHRLHHGDRPDALPAAAAERHRQLRQDRPAAAGPDRADRLRPGQGPAVRRPVGHALRVLQGTAHGAARRGGPATASPALPQGPTAPVPGEPRNRLPRLPTAAAALEG